MTGWGAVDTVTGKVIGLVTDAEINTLLKLIDKYKQGHSTPVHVVKIKIGVIKNEGI